MHHLPRIKTKRAEVVEQLALEQVEKTMGAGVERVEMKSCGSCALGRVGEASEEGAESMDDTERHFVRTGVRAGCVGGTPFVLLPL